MHNESTIFIYIDEETTPIGEYKVPVHFDFDTTKIVDGKHILKVVSRSSSGKEGIRKIPFTVRNGPSIAVEGLDKDAVVDGVLPLMINAYSKGDQKKIFDRRKRNPPKHSGLVMGGDYFILRLGYLLYYRIPKYGFVK